MSASDTADAGSGMASTVGKGLGLGSLTGGAADWLEGNGFDRVGGALGNLGGSVSDLVASVTPDFISDFVSGIVRAARGGGDVAGEAAGMLVPYVLDVVPVVV